ncbi:hypothetical protein L596_007530 [Steinernema carpocapsae]|nr:hypothetical protein L596_007530 [Steinernema carpocapsae]
MSEIEEIPTVYAEETETSSSDRLPPLHDDTKRRSNHLKPASLKLNYPRRESWTENIAESLTNEVAPPASAPIPAPRRNSAWISDEGEPRSSQLLPPSGTPEGSFVFDRSDGTRSPTPSQTSKRTSISGDFATHMRSKIREQARSVVAKKRGSVQLEKRLARRQTQSTFDEAYSVNEDEEIDAEIEESLALGEKYTSNNEMITYHEQNEFFTGTAPSGGEDEKREKTRASSLVHFVKASPSTVSERLRHATQILYYNKNTEFDETQFMNNESSLLVARPLRDWNIAKQRFGTDFVDSYGHLKGAELMMTRVPLRVERDHDEDRRLLKRSGCVRWGENTSFDRKNLHQLDLRLEKIVFDRHWLFTSEDTLAMDIRKLHDVQKATGENVVRMLKDFITQKKRIMVTNDDETKKLLQANVDRIWAELGNEQSTYAKLGESIEEQWDNLVAERATNSTSVTTLNLEKTYLKPDGFADLGDEMGLFYRTPVYTLTETNPLPEERPLSEKQRFEAIQGTHFLIQIHFNGIPVCKTRSRTLSNEFTVDFNQSYNIKVHDSPHTITLTILERTQNTEYRELAKVGVPLPDQNQLTTPQTPLESVEFASNKPIPK